MPQPGLFGKMPSVGDFVSRGFSGPLCETLDHLLESALTACTADGADAREVMAQAKPVMIAIRPGALCASGFSGLWYPSQDRVGRVFPLCVGLETAPDQARVPLLWPSQEVTALLGGTVMQALGAGGGPDELLAALPDRADWEAALMRQLPFGDVGDETVPDIAYKSSLFAMPGPEDRMTVATRSLCSRLPWVSQVLGTVVRPDGVPDWYFGSRSMLVWTQFAALFDGRWQHWEWTVRGGDAPESDAPVPPDGGGA